MQNSDKIRLFILGEVMFLYTIVVWTVWYTNLNTNFEWLYIVLFSSLFYLAIVSPFVHHRVDELAGRSAPLGSYFWESRGLGSPLAFFIHKANSKSCLRRYPQQVLWTLLAFTTLYINFIYEKKAWLNIELSILEGNPVITGLLILLVMVFATFVMLSFMNRWDTYGASLTRVLKIITGGTAVFILLHIALRGLTDLPLTTSMRAAEKWDNFSIGTFFSFFTGYVFWAWLQQFFFLSIINTYLSRAIDISITRNYHVVAISTALLFGMIHLPNIWLFVCTFAGGIFLVYAFMSHRNLFVIAIAHAVFAGLYYQLLSFSLSPGIRGYAGPAPLYFFSKYYVFLTLFAVFLLLMWSHGRTLVKSKLILAVLFIGFIVSEYPSISEGPDFYGGSTGNIRTFRMHDMVLQGGSDDYTQFRSDGHDPYLISQQLGIPATTLSEIEIDMAVDNFSREQDLAQLFLDTGSGFSEDKVYTIRQLHNERHSYRISIQLDKPLLRLRLDPTVYPDAQVRLYAIRIK
jgi:hypothetical protein